MSTLTAILIILFLFALIVASFVYVVLFFALEYYDEAESKKELIMLWTIPFYHWCRLLKDFIIDQIDDYKALD
ncbi:MAG: hypothetical protein GY804_03650 [Alphaproteobacteria bacterium]|nr:hypothetical protein [Alphaproteobacteria bacterium]